MSQSSQPGDISMTAPGGEEKTQDAAPRAHPCPWPAHPSIIEEASTIRGETHLAFRLSWWWWSLCGDFGDGCSG
jgi:hypothetical protein